MNRLNYEYADDDFLLGCCPPFGQSWWLMSVLPYQHVAVEIPADVAAS